MAAAAPTSKRTPIIIVGAGIAGVAAARVFREHAIAFEILEKSTGAFGRIATRVQQSDSFNYGAYKFEVRSAAWVAHLGAANIGVPELRAAMQPTGAGLRPTLAPLLEGLPIHYSTHVAALHLPTYSELGGSPLSVVLAGGAVIQAPAVVVAVPAPQAAQLIAECTELSPTRAALHAMQYELSCVVTARVDPLRAAEPVLGAGWQARATPVAPASAPGARLQQWELRGPRAEPLRQLADGAVARDLFPSPFALERLAYLHVKHWRYARPALDAAPRAEPRQAFLLCPQLCFVGDWAHGSVESAHESGTNGARALLAELGAL